MEKSKRCDFVPDCLDRSDEQNCAVGGSRLLIKVFQNVLLNISNMPNLARRKSTRSKVQKVSGLS